MTDSISEGMSAPEFTLQNQDGQEVTLSSYQGKKLVVYFYPKDFTPGWTTEACELRDEHAGFEDAEVSIVGISPDSMEKHLAFKTENGLPFPLLSDPDHAVAEAYQAWGERSMYGKTFMGILRSTFLIDEHGTIQKIWRNVKPAGHAQQVLEEIS